MRRMILLFFLLVAGSLYAENFYVTSAAEIAATMKSAQPGDTLIMRQGVWTDQQIKFQGNGEEDNPIVLIAEKPGFVVLNGFSSLRISGNYLEVNGLHFVGGSSRSGAPIEFRNGSSPPAHHCRLTNTAIIDYNPSSLSTD